MKRANVSDPVVTFQDADKFEHPTNSEDIDREPFLMRERTEEEVWAYDRGIVAGLEGKEPDGAKSITRQRGWAEA
jgi:hypothetical protein